MAGMGAIMPGAVFANHSKNQLIKPQKLNKGDTVGLVAPASCAFEPATIREGVETLKSLGYEVEMGKHIKEKYGYLAGSDKQRVEDLHHMFLDDNIKAIVALRGGYGSMRLLNRLDYNLTLINR